MPMAYTPYHWPFWTGLSVSQPMFDWMICVKHGLQLCWTRSSTIVSNPPASPGAAKMASRPAWTDAVSSVFFSQVSGQVQLAEVVAEVVVARRVVDAVLGLEQGGVGAGVVGDVEAEVQPVLGQRPLEHDAHLVHEQFVAEAVLARLDRLEAGAG